MLKLLRKPNVRRSIAAYFLVSFLAEILMPTAALALTSGPGQEEFASFEPAATTDMVDLYSGDYNYNIPLLSVPGPNGGYPINIAYHSGVGMEQEASWVGLGWTLNVGAINRNLRGLPDDYNGDVVTKIQHVKENISTSLDIPTRAYNESVGFPVSSGATSNSLQLYYNNYKGLGTRYTFSATKGNESASMGLAISFDSQNGMGLGLSFNASGKLRQSGLSGGFGLSANYNSRQGLQSVNFSTKANYEKAKALTQDDRNFAGTFGGGSSSTLSFGTVFGVPKTNIEMKTTTVPFSLRIGQASMLFQFKSPMPVSGSVTTSSIERNGIDNVPAQGYINTSGQSDVLKDFSRQDIMYSKKIPHLATSSFTYDLYTQTGQGTGSMFRPYLNTFGVLSDPQKTSKDRIAGGGFEIGLGSSGTDVDIHLGGDYEYGDGENTSGRWVKIKNDPDWGPEFEKLLSWAPSNSNIDYEPYYFQVIGEKTGYHVSDDQLNDFKGDEAIRVRLEKEKHDDSFLNRHFVASDHFVHNEAETPSTSNDFDGVSQTKQKASHKRAIRSTSVETMTNGDAHSYGFSKNVKYLEGGVLKSKDFSKPAHHISEISMLQPDGMRYVYGLPTYNNSQVDNSFAITEDAGSAANYPDAAIHTGGSRNFGGINVTGTQDEYVSKNQLPAYANSWLLTTVLSSDYLDVTNNGPTEDDFGYWVKFNYEKIAADYNWRIPFADANYMDGTKNNNKDNKGSYTFGKKDVYVLVSIETKTHIAIFKTSPRRDGYEAKNEFEGGRGVKTMKKLDNIKLYTKKEYAKPVPVPTKVINFEYNYELCQGIPNNSGVAETVNGVDINAKHGKLTLKKLYFTYQTSDRGKLSPYVFNYGDADDQQDNPDYNKSNMDRWGNYKNPASYEYLSGSTTAITYPYLEHPYTEQNPGYYTGADGLKAAPWTLKEIALPTGGTLKVQYDFDDYGYVENKQAMQMFDICYLQKESESAAYVGDMAGNSQRNTAANAVKTEESNTGKNRVYFKLDKTIQQTLIDMGMYDAGSVPATNSADAIALFNKLYIENAGGYIYFNIYSNLQDTDPADVLYDYVKGYAEIQPGTGGIVSNGLSGTSEVQYGYFTLKNKPLASPVNITGFNVSPFTIAALQHLRAYRSDILFPYSTGGASPASQILGLFGALPGMMTDLMSTTMGFNNYAYLKKWGQNIQTNGYSTIRLCKPDYKKIGGGARVKKITLDDGWKNGATALNSLYGQSYDYTKSMTIDGKEVQVSSGVCYEPMVGGDESALRSPITYTNSIPLHGSYNLFMENPILESYYPGPNVGYSKVTVTSIAPEQAVAESTVGGGVPSNILQQSAAPITISEFYTPKDFPVLFDKTDMNPGQPIKIPMMIPGVLTDFKTRQAKSQGYSIVLNDMAGKPKAVTTKTRGGEQIISRQKFIYNTESTYNEDAINKLSSKVQTLEIDKDTYEPKYITSVVGQSHDMFIDMNEDAQKMESFGLETNFDMHYTPTYTLLFMVMPIPTVKVDESSLRTVVFNKVINRTGILKKVETTTDESTIIMENLAFDIETGEPLLTKVTNEFKDPVYNFDYPGHWYYPNMRGAYNNTGLKIDPAGSASIVSDANGYLNLSSYLPSGKKTSDLYAKGDLIHVDAGSATGDYHVLNVYDPSKLLLINSTGRLFPPATNVYAMKVIRSGFKNMQSVKVGNVAFKKMHATNSADLFEDYLPSDNAGTKRDALTPFEIESAGDNQIINASAIEYSNDWQVFCGSKTPGDSVTICEPPPDILAEYLSMIQQIKLNGLLPATTGVTVHPVLYTESTNTYTNGFTSGLLAENLFLTDAVADAANSEQLKLAISYGSGAGGVNEMDLTFETDYHAASCRAYFIAPPSEYYSVPEFWNSIVSYSSLVFTGWGPSVIGGSYGRMMFQATMANGSTANISLEIQGFDASECSQQPVEGPGREVHGCCWDFNPHCYTVITPDYSCGIQMGEPINPYWAGMKGLWRPKASYAYHSSRTQNDNIKEDGAFTDYARFPWEAPATKDPKWITASTITKYSPHGFELENKDALGNYSGALYGYEQSLVTAVGSNAKYNELAFDNFEDYPVSGFPKCSDNFFHFADAISNVTTSYAHTGKYSMEVIANTSVDIQSTVASDCPFVPIDDVTNPAAYVPDPHASSVHVAHLVNSCDCLGEFAPEANKKYVASVWVKEISSSGPFAIGVTNYTAPELKITVDLGTSTVVYSFVPQGNVIDGWQQINGTFNIPSAALGITVEMKNTASGKTVYFDDIRLHPADGNMVSYVYDPVSLKVMAELDANNFATFYVYDDEGHLNKVKKETTEGIKTIKEGRINTKKLNE